MDSIPKISESFVRAVVPRRPAAADKGTFGRLLIRGGSLRYPHAPVLAALGALRSGVGLVALAVPECSRPCAAFHVPEAIFHLPDDDESRYNVMVFGPGAGTEDLSVPAFGKLLIDADGLNRLASADTVPEHAASEWILTPHPGEAARLLRCKVAEVQNDRAGAARELARRYGGVAVLKGAGTLVCSQDGYLWENTTGNPGMATAGSGDVLSGIIGALWAQGMSAFDAARAGVWIHGRAGDEAAESIGQAAVTACEIARKICVFS